MDVAYLEPHHLANLVVWQNPANHPPVHRSHADAQKFGNLFPRDQRCLNLQRIFLFRHFALATPSHKPIFICMLSKILKLIIPGIASAIAIKGSAYLEKLNTPKILAVFIAVCVAASFAVIADEVLIGAKKYFLFIRKIMDKRARFEGDWFVSQDEGSRMPYGAISIDYNAETDGYVYNGQSYDNAGKIASEWACDRLQFDIPNSRVRFIAQTIVKGESGAEHVAYGWISFRRVFESMTSSAG